MAGTDMTVEWIGDDKLRETLMRAGAEAPALLGSALFQEAELVMTAAKRLTPVGGGMYSPYDKTPGTLRASGHVKPPVIAGNDASVTLGFGGAASAYAHRQHEEVTWRHVVGQAKFLEEPFMAALPGLPTRLRVRLERVLFR